MLLNYLGIWSEDKHCRAALVSDDKTKMLAQSSDHCLVSWRITLDENDDEDKRANG